jgi:hypothetical protein
MTVALVDTDSITYRCGFAAEKTFYLVQSGVGTDCDIFDSSKAAKDYAASCPGATIWTRKEVEPLEHCLATVKSSLIKTLEITGATSHKLYLSGKTNFRQDIYPEYKANRETMNKPKYYKDIRRYLVDNWKAEIVEGYEADDAMGIGQMTGSDTIIVSQDKDMAQIPGRHYNWVTGLFTTITPQQGMRFFYEQLLSGDSTDNIPGIPGIGTKKAQAALESAKTPRELAEISYSMYRDSLGHTPDSEVDLMARLVWIWRKPNDKHPLWRHLGRESV